MGRSRNNYDKLLSQKLKNANKRELATPRIEKLLSTLDPNDAESLLEIAVNYLSFEDYTSASQWLSGSAKLGNREAMFFLGRLELKAKSDPKWLIKAAELGDSDAAIMIADYFSKTKRGTGDLELAAYWFEWLIDRGEPQVREQYFGVLLDQGNTAKVWPIIFSKDNDVSKFFDYVRKALKSRACTIELIEAVVNDPRSSAQRTDSGFLFMIAQSYQKINDPNNATKWHRSSYDAGYEFAKILLDRTDPHNRR